MEVGREDWAVGDQSGEASSENQGQLAVRGALERCRNEEAAHVVSCHLISTTLHFILGYSRAAQRVNEMKERRAVFKTRRTRV